MSFTCKSSAFLSAVDACEAKTCSPYDISRTFTLSIQICEPVGGSNAIGLGNLLSCAQPGLANATAESGCSPTNWTYICASPAYTIDAAKYEEQYCSAADRQAILVYTSNACAAVGIQLEPAALNAQSGRPSSTSSSLAPKSSAQSVYDFPQCAQPCVDAALLQSGCQPSDWECICVNPAFVGGETASCELQSCNVNDQYVLGYWGGAGSGHDVFSGIERRFDRLQSTRRRNGIISVSDGKRSRIGSNIFQSSQMCSILCHKRYDQEWG